MKTNLFASLLLLTSLAAKAETQLACWNMYAKTGSQPILKAVIQKDNVLDIELNLKEEYFAGYSFDKKSCFLENTSCMHQVGQLTQPASDLFPTLNESNRSPYKGHNEYSFSIGTYTYDYSNTKTPASNQHKVSSVDARLVLPTNLSANFLKTYRIRNLKERSNAVMILDPSRDSDQGGQSYLRLFCVSR